MKRRWRVLIWTKTCFLLSITKSRPMFTNFPGTNPCFFRKPINAKRNATILFGGFLNFIDNVLFGKHKNYFTKSSIGTPNALAILATVWTLGLITTLLSIFVRVVCFTPDFLTKSSWVKPSLFRAFLMFSPIVAIVSIL